MSDRKLCWICYRFAAPTLKAVIRHIGSVHSFDPGFRICCGIQECPRIYTNWNSFRKHLYRKHGTEMETVPSNEPVTHLNIVDTTDNLAFEPTLSDALSSSSQDRSHAQMQLKRQAAIFLLKSKEIYKTSQLSLDGIISEITTLWQQHLTVITNGIETQLSTLGIQQSCINEALSFNERINPFHGLHSRFLQEKYFSEELHLLVCLYVHTYVFYHVILL